MLTCSLTASQILGGWPTATFTPTRTARPTWTPIAGSATGATQTPDRTRFSTPAPSLPALATPQIIVPGATQGLVIPAGVGGVQTVVIVIVTATPFPSQTPLPPGPTPTPGPTSTPVPPPATPTPTATPQPPVVVHVTTDKANVRTGPGTTYPLVTQLDTGTVVTVVGRNQAGDWWKICCINGADVWIANSVVRVEGPLWNVAEISNLPPPPPPPTNTPTPGYRTPTPTATSIYPFHLEAAPGEYPQGEDYFKVLAIIYNGSVPMWNYKLKIRKWSTGQEWISAGSNVAYSCEILDFHRITPVPIHPCFGPDLKFNVKWDGNGLSVPMGNDTWEVTAINSAGYPVSEPVRLNTSADKPKWYYVVFTTK